MISIAADLHIHSCLSPCADDGMTPFNIANMAMIKGLKMISLTDHNTTRNLPAIQAACRQCGLILVPGIEVQSKEDVHLLCYFLNLDAAMDFGALMEGALPPQKNVPGIFGTQVIRNENDDSIGELDVLLLQSVHFDIGQIFAMTAERGGLCIPAHINRQANSLLYTLGFFPEKPVFTTVELNALAPMPTMDLGRRHILYASDAHMLENIFEADNRLQIDEISVAAFIRKYSRMRD